MDIILLRKVAQYTSGSFKVPAQLKGYSDEEVKNAVNMMVEDGVITFGKATKFSPTIGNFTVKEGKQVPLASSTEMDIAYVCKLTFEKCYGEEVFPKDSY